MAAAASTPLAPFLSSSEYPHFTGETAEAQGGHVSCPEPLRLTVTLELWFRRLMLCPLAPDASGNAMRNPSVTATALWARRTGSPHHHGTFGGGEKG